MKGMTVMYDYRGKIAGVIISALGLTAMIVERISGFTFLHDLNSEQHYSIFLWCTLFGFMLIAYSREKYDDERARQIRAKAMQISFGVLISVMLALSLTSTLHPEMKIESATLYMLASMALLLYLLVFHAGLHLDFLWEYGDKGLWENWRNIGRNKWGILAYLAICFIMLALLSFL